MCCSTSHYPSPHNYHPPTYHPKPIQPSPFIVYRETARRLTQMTTNVRWQFPVLFHLISEDGRFAFWYPSIPPLHPFTHKNKKTIQETCHPTSYMQRHPLAIPSTSLICFKCDKCVCVCVSICVCVSVNDLFFLLQCDLKFIK